MGSIATILLRSSFGLFVSALLPCFRPSLLVRIEVRGVTLHHGQQAVGRSHKHLPRATIHIA
eukprot:4260695-Amphidinium_carterae.1